MSFNLRQLDYDALSYFVFIKLHNAEELIDGVTSLAAEDDAVALAVASKGVRVKYPDEIV
jgi:hypothetical protein